MLNDDYRDMLSAFSAENVKYLVVGAYALAVHGRPRATGDIDFWVLATHTNAKCVLRALTTFGAATSDITIDDLSQPGLVIQIGVAPRRIDILTSIDGVDDFESAWTARDEVVFDGITVPVISRSDLIATKRATGRLQDLADAEWLEEEGEQD